MDSLASPGASKRNYNNLEMAVLHQISRVLVHKTDVNQLLKDVLQILNSEMGLLRGTVTLRQGDLLFTGAPVAASPALIGDRLEAYLDGEKLLTIKVK